MGRLVRRKSVGRTSLPYFVGYRTYLCGDANDDDYVDILDIMVLIDYKFKSGPPPAYMEASDVNCDDIVNTLDIIYLIDHKLQNGDAPCCGLCCDYSY